MALLALVVLVVLADAWPALGADRWDALQALPRVDLEVTFSPNHPDLTPDELRRRIEESLRRMPPAPAIAPGNAERLRLTVGVRVYNGSDLRGFYLPFSQDYGIGPVRLSVERPAVVPGLTSLVSATVWQSERQAKGPWRGSANEILELTDEVLGSFLADYRRALGQ